MKHKLLLLLLLCLLFFGKALPQRKYEVGIGNMYSILTDSKLKYEHRFKAGLSWDFKYNYKNIPVSTGFRFDYIMSGTGDDYPLASDIYYAYHNE